MKSWRMLLPLAVFPILSIGVQAQDPDHPSVDDVAERAVQYQNQFKLDEFEALMDESRTSLRDAAEAGSVNPDVYRALYLDAVQSEDEAAARWILKLYELEPANASNAVLAGQALFSQGRPHEAVELLSAHRREHGALTTVGPMLATLQFATQDLDGARSTIDELLASLEPDSPMGLILRPTVESLEAEILLYEGKPEEAREILRGLHEIAPQDASIELALGRALFALGEYEAALGHLQDLLLPAPKNFIAACYQGLTLEQLDRTDEAQSAFEKAYDQGRRVEDQLGSEGEALLILSLVAEKLGEEEHARNLKERAAGIGFTAPPPALRHETAL